MKSMIRCSACGRKRKLGHEKRVGTDKAYSPDCKKLEKWREDRKKELEAAKIA